jgi:hypothetical protein
MTVLEHIKQLVAGLTPKQKDDLARALVQPSATPDKPLTLRGDWTTAFACEGNLEQELSELRNEWRKEWRSDKFVG